MFRKARIATLMAGVCVLWATSAASAASGPIAWRTDYDSARAEAQASNKLLLVNVHATWCVPCKKLQAGTLSDPTLGAEIMQNCVPLSLDADHDAAVVRQWPISGYTTQLFLSPDGKIVNAIVGNVPVGTYRAAMYKAVQSAGLAAEQAKPQREANPAAAPPSIVANDPAPQQTPQLPPAGPSTFPPPLHPATDLPAVVSNSGPATPPATVAAPAPPATQPAQPMMARQPSPTRTPTPAELAAAQTPTAPRNMTYDQTSRTTTSAAKPAPAQTAETPAAQPKRQVIYDQDIRPCDMSVPLALNGYCPVSMFQRAELIHGSEGECCVYKNRRYQFLTTAEREAFLKNPKKYLPAEDGLCVVTWAEDHRRAPGNIELPALFGDYLFLFASEDARRRFLQDPEQYVDSTGHAHRIPMHSFRGANENVR